jgi:hypothetical protein
MQKAVAVAQFLGQLAVEVPSAVKTVELPPHFPDLRVDAFVTVIEPFYAKFRHIRKSTVVVSVAALLTSVLTGALPQSSQKYVAPKSHVCIAKHPSAIFQDGGAPDLLK